jgi:prolipoprotein diacylglyceryltransferase
VGLNTWCPRYWHIWGIPLSAYSVFLYLGGSLWLAAFSLHALRTFKEEDALNLGTLIMASSVILGGTIFLGSSGRFGLSFYGAALGALIVVFLYCHRRKLSLLEVGDLGALPTALAFSVMKIGCLIGGCCYGRPTPYSLYAVYSSQAGEKAPKVLLDMPDLAGVPLYPVQLWVSAASLGIFILLLILRKPLSQVRGRNFGLGLALYAASRWVIDFWSGERPPVAVAGLAANQWLGLGMLAVAGLILARGRSPQKLEHA